MTKNLPWFFVGYIKDTHIARLNEYRDEIEDLGFYRLSMFDFQGMFPVIPIESFDGLLYPNSFKGD